jgi:hypothetical protein
VEIHQPFHASEPFFFLVMAIRFSATAVRASEGTSAVYTGKHTWPSLSRPTLEMAVTPRVGGYMRPCGRVSGNGLGETESHWEKNSAEGDFGLALESGDMVGEIRMSLLQAAQYLDECNVEIRRVRQ